MTGQPFTAPRDSAPAVAEAHYWRAVDQAVAIQAAAAQADAGRWSDGTEPGMRVLTFPSVAELQAAAAQADALEAARELMHRAAWRAQRAGHRWLCTARRAAALEAAEPGHDTAAASITPPCKRPLTRTWEWPPPAAVLRDQLEPLTRRSNAPNAARAAIPPGGRT